jgi:hypothetical protein
MDQLEAQDERRLLGSQRMAATVWAAVVVGDLLRASQAHSSYQA